MDSRLLIGSILATIIIIVIIIGTFYYSTKYTNAIKKQPFQTGSGNGNSGLYPLITTTLPQLPPGWDNESPDNAKHIVNPILTGGVTF